MFYDLLWFLLPAAIATGAAILFKKLGWINEGCVGVRNTYGKADRDKNGQIIIRKPGFVKMLPGKHTVSRANMRTRHREVSNLPVEFASGHVYFCSLFAVYKVINTTRDIEMFLYGGENPLELIDLKLTAEAIEILKNAKNRKDATLRINRKLPKILKSYMKENFGIELIACGLSQCVQTEIFQQHEVFRMKLEKVREIYVELNKAPVSVIAACFGAIPIATPGENYEQEIFEDTVLGESAHEESGRIIVPGTTQATAA